MDEKRMYLLYGRVLMAIYCTGLVLAAISMWVDSETCFPWLLATSLTFMLTTGGMGIFAFINEVKDKERPLIV
jgi:hypothetical protein